MILTQFLICRAYQFYKTKSLHLRSSAQELAITSLFALSHITSILWVPLSMILFLRWYGFFRYQADIFQFLKSPKCFIDSLQATPLSKQLLAGVCLTFCSYPLVQVPLSFWIPLFLISIFFSFYKPRIPHSLPEFSFPHEISTSVSPLYPALRKTHAFLGEKRFCANVKKPNIVFIFLESFRARNVGCLGAKIPASPCFDAWAKKGVLFRNFHANGLQTFRAFLSAYFGIPGHLKTVSLKPFCSMSMTGLPQILKRQGYHPAVIQSGDISFDYLYPFFKQHGFETIIGGEEIQGPRTSSWGVDDESMVRFAASWLEKQINPTFLSLFTITNHHPWKVPSSWGDPKKDPYSNFLQTFAYTDFCLNLFLESINLNNSILFIAGDHGQEMGERRPYSEMNQSLFEENIHLPLLILGQQIKPQIIDSNASFVDFLPTVLDLLNLQETHHSLGMSLLREIHFPSYFSMHRGDLQIGCLLGKKKVILDKGFDLETDPEEKNPIDMKDLSIQCKNYFLKMNAMMETNAWAPQNDLFSLKAAPLMNEEEWIVHVNQHPNIPVIDLTSGNFGDTAITKLDHSSWFQVSLRDCTRITDVSLHWMGKYCKNIMTLDLSNCHLLTDTGVRQILLPTLRHIWLDGLDLEDFVPHNICLNLRTLSLKNIPRLSAKSLVSLYKGSSHLISWSATLTNVKNQDLLEMSQAEKQCTNMTLCDGIHITDEALSQILYSQRNLQEIHLENFPLIEQPDFSKLTKLRYLTIEACPRLNQTFYESLKDLPIPVPSFY